MSWAAYFRGVLPWLQRTAVKPSGFACTGVYGRKSSINVAQWRLFRQVVGKGHWEWNRFALYEECMGVHVQPGEVKLVSWRLWMRATQLHAVTSRIQLHCTRLYLHTLGWPSKHFGTKVRGASEGGGGVQANSLGILIKKNFENYGRLLKSFLPSFSCCLEQYKLVSVKSTERFQGIDACWGACSDVGMGVMQLHSDKDRLVIVNLPDYYEWNLVITDGIEVLDKSGHATFFSSPGGKQINFISLTDKIGKRRSNTPGNYFIVIYRKHYYSADFFAVNTTKHVQCACSLRSKGERWLYNRHANFDADRLLPQCKLHELEGKLMHFDFTGALTQLDMDSSSIAAWTVVDGSAGIRNISLQQGFFCRLSRLFRSLPW